MQIPAAMFIESAADALRNKDEHFQAVITDQNKELRAFGAGRAVVLGASGLSEDFKIGYNLGLQTARTIIRMSPALMLKGVNPEEVL